MAPIKKSPEKRLKPYVCHVHIVPSEILICFIQGGPPNTDIVKIGPDDSNVQCSTEIKAGRVCQTQQKSVPKTEKLLKCLPNKSRWIILNSIQSKLHYFSISRSIGGTLRRHLQSPSYYTCLQVSSLPAFHANNTVSIYNTSYLKIKAELPKASVEQMQCLDFSFMVKGLCSFIIRRVISGIGSVTKGLMTFSQDHRGKSSEASLNSPK